MPVLDLQEELCFYKAYHNNPVNVRIHMVFIPIILASAIVFLSYIELPSQLAPFVLPQPLYPYSSYFNIGTFIAVSFSTFYCLLDRLGLVVAPVLVSFSILTKRYIINTATAQQQRQILIGAIAVQLAGWVAQFFGHGAYEKRKPALLDSLVQALVLAPFFVVFEIVFALGFRKELEVALENQVARVLSEQRRKKELKKDDKVNIESKKKALSQAIKQEREASTMDSSDSDGLATRSEKDGPDVSD